VADNLYTKVLRQAVELDGSPSAIASRLRVPEGTLMRWISGRAQMPLLAFLEAMQYVAEREPETPAEGQAIDEKLSFQLGPMSARCEACDGTEFRRADQSKGLRYASTLVCRACGTEVKHGHLVVQLAKEVSQLARTRLVRLKRSQVAIRASLPRNRD